MVRRPLKSIRPVGPFIELDNDGEEVVSKGEPKGERKSITVE